MAEQADQLCCCLPHLNARDCYLHRHPELRRYADDPEGDNSLVYDPDTDGECECDCHHDDRDPDDDLYPSGRP